MTVQWAGAPKGVGAGGGGGWAREYPLSQCWLVLPRKREGFSLQPPLPPPSRPSHVGTKPPGCTGRVVPVRPRMMGGGTGSSTKQWPACAVRTQGRTSRTSK